MVPEMQVEQAFVSAVLANPADDAPRQMYADWLMGQPDPRQRECGEFIALQLHLAQREAEWGPAPLVQLQAGIAAGMRLVSPQEVQVAYEREADLSDLRKRCLALEAWLEIQPPWATWAQSGNMVVRRLRPIYRRGFVAEVECTLEGWIREGPGIVSREPVERVRLTDVAEELSVRVQLASPAVVPAGYVYEGERRYFWECIVLRRLVDHAGVEALYGPAAAWALDEGLYYCIQRRRPVPSREEAVAWLSPGLLGWARIQATARTWPRLGTTPRANLPAGPAKDTREAGACSEADGAV